MSEPVTLIGNPVSPYVRKVLAACALKGVEVRLDPLTPFMGDDDFERLSPLRRIPVWIEGDVVLCDSSVILQYLEETRPGPSLWPADPVDRARARYIEEVADTNERFDRAVLDLPDPWTVLPALASALEPGGVLGAYLPTTVQVQELVLALPRGGVPVAAPGEALISEACYTAGGLDLGELESRQLELKGKSEPIPARVLQA